MMELGLIVKDGDTWILTKESKNAPPQNLDDILPRFLLKYRLLEYWQRSDVI
jgi:hypothetical protein